MGTEKHSKASKDRWKNITPKDRAKKMSVLSKSGWDKLDTRARRKRALSGVRTREAKIKKRNEMQI